MAKPNRNRVLQVLPLVVGGLGGLLLAINRLLTPELMASQARSDIVGVILSAFSILTGLLWQQIQANPPESVEIIGEEGFELSPDLSDSAKRELAWASSLLLTNTMTKTIYVWYPWARHGESASGCRTARSSVPPGRPKDSGLSRAPDNGGKVLLRRGILSANSEFKMGAILQQVLNKQKSVYLVDLKLYPGRIEFDYLPENIQGLICQPIGNEGVIILGSNAPRSYTKQDQNWVEGIAEKLADTLLKEVGENEKVED